ncbi:CaiB/BaiF CoA transferase family protein [Thioclava sp.]|uniref:CaiB/BaiF CoA transferase family protein n=1 Tax=Thioclava sp. TaxID=1933450 RepID=UPI003AA7E0D1
MSDATPLAGLRVLDLTRVLAGPWATQLMADLGAEVIKLERPGTGDDTRSWGPPFAALPDGSRGESAYFLSANRGKKSVEADLSTSRGRDLARDLARQSDILIENFRVGGTNRMGLDYDTLSAENSGLIYCSITGFGQTGPHRHRPGYDLLVQAMGGLMSVTGESEGRPMKAGVALADIMTGLYATSAILAAVHERARSGRGDYIDLSLLDVQIATLANQAQNYLVSGTAPGRSGNVHPNIAPYQDFQTADGAMVVAVGNDSQFQRLCDGLGAPDLATDPRFATNALRVGNQKALEDALAPVLRNGTTRTWLAILDTHGVPAAAINDIAAVFSDPQIEARGLLTGGDDNLPLVACPIRFRRMALSAAIRPPNLGEHNGLYRTSGVGSDIQQEKLHPT